MAKFIFLFTLLLFINGLAAAELPEVNVKKTKTPPVVDGVVNDQCWETAVSIKGLKPAIKKNDQKRIDAVPTEIRLAWDKDYLYALFLCRDDDIVCSGTVERDGNIYKEDACEIFIDAKGDGRQWFEIQVNPLNQTMELMTFCTAEKPEVTETGRLTPAITATDRWSFRGWNPEGLLTATGRLVENGKVVGWIVEAAIPAKHITRRLGIKELQPLKLRANLVRYDHKKEKDGKMQTTFMNWSPVQHGCPHISPGAMGKMNLVE